jgi:hypothetical protein
MNQEQIEQYVASRMSQAEAEAFEEYCVANPEFAKQVEFEQLLKRGIAEVARGSTAEFVRSNHPMRFRLALAAGVLLALSAGLYVWHLVPKVATPIMAAVATNAPRSGASMRLAMVRGAEHAPTLQPGLVRVEIVGLFDLGFHYRIDLDRLEKRKSVVTIATLYSQHPTSPVTLEVMVDSDQLEPGAYSLRVRRQASEEDAFDFGFMKF